MSKRQRLPRTRYLGSRFNEHARLQHGGERAIGLIRKANAAERSYRTLGQIKCPRTPEMSGTSATRLKVGSCELGRTLEELSPDGSQRSLLRYKVRTSGATIGHGGELRVFRRRQPSWLPSIVIAIAVTAAFTAQAALVPRLHSARPPQRLILTGSSRPRESIKVRFKPEGPCPSAALVRVAEDVSNAGPSLRTRLLPPGAIYGRLCQYGNKDNSRPYELLRTSILTVRTTVDFQKAIDSLKIGTPSAVPSCLGGSTLGPAVTLLAFAYQDRAAVDLWYNPACRTLDNGYVRAWYVRSPVDFTRFIQLLIY